MCKDKGAYGNSLNFFIQFFCEHESSLKNKVGHFFFFDRNFSKSHLGSSCSGGLVWGIGICLFHKFPDDADVQSKLRTTG